MLSESLKIFGHHLWKAALLHTPPAVRLVEEKKKHGTYNTPTTRSLTLQPQGNRRAPPPPRACTGARRGRRTHLPLPPVMSSQERQGHLTAQKTAFAVKQLGADGSDKNQLAVITSNVMIEMEEGDGYECVILEGAYLTRGKTAEAEVNEDECGKLIYWLYGCRPAAQAWEEHYSGVLEAVGFKRLLSSPVAFYHEERDLVGVVHGDDFVFVGVDEELDFGIELR